MGGLVVLLTTARNGWRSTSALLASAALLFVAFLAKYIVAVYLPVVCLGVFLVPRLHRTRPRTSVVFILPLCLAVLAYFVAFSPMLIFLLQFSLTYAASQSGDLWHVCLWRRPELWLLAIAAVVGVRRASMQMRVSAVCGSGILIAFQLLSRTDSDWWKHSME